MFSGYGLLILFFVVLNLALLRVLAISTFKSSYYAEKLKNRGVDISSVENITMIEIIKL